MFQENSFLHNFVKKAPKYLNNYEVEKMNILISADLKLKKTIQEHWPFVGIEKARDLEEVVKKLADHHFDLLILDVDMPGNEKLKNTIADILTDYKIVISSSRHGNYRLASDLMLLGVQVFISQSVSELETMNILAYVINSMIL